MRNIKFDPNKSSYDNDDIAYAFECNDLALRLKDIDVIVAEICGQNDEDEWFWILQMKDQTYSWAKGGCDYTGWGCQSSAEIHDGFDSPVRALEDLKFREYGESRDKEAIKKCLLLQLEDELPFAVFDPNILSQ